MPSIYRTGGAKLPPVIVMGVSGCGKSVVGAELAAALGWRFIEGDELHPPENVARMASGQPLTDDHRKGWLDAIAVCLNEASATGDGAIATCSALKRAYRDRLTSAAGDILFIHLAISPELARQRVSSRRGHFMPASLVDSQFRDLEPPDTDELAVKLDGSLAIKDLVELSRATLTTIG